MKTKSKKIISYLLIMLLIAAMAMIFAACKANNEDYSYMISNEFTPANVTIINNDKYDNIAIKLNENRDIKVLQLSDIHLGNGAMSVKKDRKAMNAVCKLIEDAKPDLIILTGDIVYPNSAFTGSSDNLSALKIIINMMEKYRTPWTMCFGNHDAEYMADYGKSALCDLLEDEKYSYCLFKRGPDNIGGMGNQVINIYNADDTFNSSIFVFDNGEYAGATQSSGYNPISNEQTDWYKSEIEKMNAGEGKTILSFAYFHVPLKEYKIAWDLYRDGNNAVKYVYGWANENGENISSPSERGKFFDTAVELGSTKAMFCGHNHLNDFSIEYQGVRLTFTKSIDYIAYFLQGIANKTEQRGSTTLIIKGLDSSMTSDFDIYNTKLTDIE